MPAATATAAPREGVKRSGVLVVHKPCGPTSHDVVAQARRVLGTRAVGHAGTLDPMASGVLILLVGEATKLSPYLTLEDKEYRATVTFGRSTTTWDAEGDTVEERAVPTNLLAGPELDMALAAERKRTEQVPPAFSAISVDGKRAHRLARRGKPVDLPPRAVQVRTLELLDRSTDPASVTLRAEVSKGYYVRSLARDLGERLGVPSHLSALERRASGPYRIEEAVPWPPTEASGAPPLLPLKEAAARALPVAHLLEEGATRARQGKVLSLEHFAKDPGPALAVAWLDPDGDLLAIGGPDEAGGFRVRRGFQPESQVTEINNAI
jgi:tRNA pseudouridine55 synthase